MSMLKKYLFIIFEKKINILMIFILMIIIGLLTLLSMFSYLAVEEGNDSKLLYFIGYLFYILRFPTHNILWEFMIGGNGGRFAVVFFFGLLFNTIFYSFLIERIIYVFKHVYKVNRQNK